MSPATLLLIEDELERLSDRTTLLRREGHHVLVTDDPPEGVRQAREEHPDAILPNLDRPGIDLVLRDQFPQFGIFVRYCTGANR